MIYELRTYTVRPGTVGEMVKAASTISRDIRADNFGKLEGYWITEIGPLNQVMHMWSYADLNERTKLRAELGKNPRWTGEYIPAIRPLLLRQEVRLMNAIIPPVAPRHQGQPLRIPQLPGQAARWCQAVARSVYRRDAGAREVFEDRRPVGHRRRAAE